MTGASHRDGQLMQTGSAPSLLMLRAPVAAVVFALLLSSVVLLIAGSNPFTAFGDMIDHGTKLETIIDMLNKATPLYISGVAARSGSG